MYVLAIDEGTTGVRAMIFDRQSVLVGSAYEEIGAAFPRPGWMEQDPLHIWEATRRVVGERCARRAYARETWPRSALPISAPPRSCGNAPAGCRCTRRSVGRIRAPSSGGRKLLSQGVFTNAMTSATKLEWVLRQRDGLRRAAAGELCFGTIDTWLLWQLSAGRVHVTDHSNAACTGMYDF